MNPRVILVTGANGGIGRAIPRSFILESAENQIWLGIHARVDQAEKLARESPDRCRGLFFGLCRSRLHHRLHTQN